MLPTQHGESWETQGWLEPRAEKPLARLPGSMDMSPEASGEGGPPGRRLWVLKREGTGLCEPPAEAEVLSPGRGDGGAAGERASSPTPQWPSLSWGEW